MKHGSFCVVIVQLVAVNQEFQLTFFEKMEIRKKILTFTKVVGLLKFLRFIIKQGRLSIRYSKNSEIPPLSIRKVPKQGCQIWADMRSPRVKVSCKSWRYLSVTF